MATTSAQYFIDGNGIKNLLLNPLIDDADMSSIGNLPTSNLKASFVMTNGGALNGQSNYEVKQWSVTYLNSKLRALGNAQKKFFETVDPTIQYTLTRVGDGERKQYTLFVENAVEIGENRNTKITQTYTVAALK
jgi:hypothetical protein